MLLEVNGMRIDGDDFNWTPLHETCERDNAELLQLLLGRKANGAVRTDTKGTPLHLLH